MIKNSADVSTGATTDINQAQTAQGTALSADKVTDVSEEKQNYGK